LCRVDGPYIARILVTQYKKSQKDASKNEFPKWDSNLKYKDQSPYTAGLMC